MLPTFLQSIEDTQPKPAITTSSSKIETAASITSGPTSTTGPLSTTSQEGETPEPDPNATYASVSMAYSKDINLYVHICTVV